MFTVSNVIKMFGGKLANIIDEKGGKLVLPLNLIESWCIKEKVPFKLTVNDNKEIVIVKR